MDRVLFIFGGFLAGSFVMSAGGTVTLVLAGLR